MWLNPDTGSDERNREDSLKGFRIGSLLFSASLQLAAAVLLFFFAGRWLDEKFGTDPWLKTIGALIGAAGGMVKLIKSAIDAGNSASAQQKPGKK